MLDVGCRMLIGCGSPLDRFDADNFGAGPGRLGVVVILTLGLVGLGGLVFGVEPVEQGVELGGIFAGQDEGFGVQAVFEAVETNGGAAFGRGRARAVLRVETVSFDLSISGHRTPLVLRFVGVWNTLF